MKARTLPFPAVLSSDARHQQVREQSRPVNHDCRENAEARLNCRLAAGAEVARTVFSAKADRTAGFGRPVSAAEVASELLVVPAAPCSPAEYWTREVC